MATSTHSFEHLARQWAVQLTTFRRDGTPVGTPVSIVVDDGRAFARTYASSGKMKRLRHCPEVELAPSTPTGRPTGPAVRARARLLAGGEAEQASRVLARKHRMLHGILVPLAHRLRGYKTVHLELTPCSLSRSVEELPLSPLEAAVRRLGAAGDAQDDDEVPVGVDRVDHPQRPDADTPELRVDDPRGARRSRLRREREDWATEARRVAGRQRT